MQRSGGLEKSSKPDVSELRGIEVYSSFAFYVQQSKRNDAEKASDEVMCGDQRHICDLRSNNRGHARTGGVILDLETAPVTSVSLSSEA